MVSQSSVDATRYRTRKAHLGVVSDVPMYQCVAGGDMSVCRFFIFLFFWFVFCFSFLFIFFSSSSSVPYLFLTTVRYCKTRYLTLWCGVESRDIGVWRGMNADIGCGVE